MANEYAVNQADLQAVADAIRNKGGTTDALTFPGGFVEAVGAIEAGGGGGNEVYYSLIDGSIASFSDSAVFKIREALFKGCNELTYINVPNVTQMDHECARQCSSLAEVHAPNLLRINTNNNFVSCYNLNTFNAPLLQRVGGEGTFERCPLGNLSILPNLENSSLRMFRHAVFTSFVLPSLIQVNTNTFIDCGNLVSVDFGAATSFKTQGLNANPVLENIIIRTNSVCSLANVNSLWGNANEPTVHPKIYVPSALIASYQVATNWSSLYTNGYITFHAIEGSVYENAYANGDPIPTT